MVSHYLYLIVELKNSIYTIVSYRMKWGDDEFIFAISSDSEFYRLIDAVVIMYDCTQSYIFLDVQKCVQIVYLKLFCMVYAHPEVVGYSGRSSPSTVSLCR